jgi:hypothetical protein
MDSHEGNPECGDEKGQALLGQQRCRGHVPSRSSAVHRDKDDFDRNPVGNEEM